MVGPFRGIIEHKKDSNCHYSRDFGPTKADLEWREVGVGGRGLRLRSNLK